MSLRNPPLDAFLSLDLDGTHFSIRLPSLRLASTLLGRSAVVDDRLLATILRTVVGTILRGPLLGRAWLLHARRRNSAAATGLDLRAVDVVPAGASDGAIFETQFGGEGVNIELIRVNIDAYDA